MHKNNVWVLVCSFLRLDRWTVADNAKQSFYQVETLESTFDGDGICIMTNASADTAAVILLCVGRQRLGFSRMF